MIDARFYELIAHRLIDHYETHVEPNVLTRSDLAARAPYVERYHNSYLRIPGTVDLNEDLYNSRALRYLEDLLQFGTLPDATLAAGQAGQVARELGQIWEDYAEVSAARPTSDHLGEFLSLFSHEGTLEDKSQAKLAINRLVLLLVKLGVADQEFFERLADVPDDYTNQYKPWAPDYDNPHGNLDPVVAIQQLAVGTQAAMDRDHLVDDLLGVLAAHPGDWQSLWQVIGQLHGFTNGFDASSAASILTPDGQELWSEYDLDHYIVDLVLKSRRG